MRLHFSDQPLPAFITHSIFLAGPSPRQAHVEDWRPCAIKILKLLEFNGDVFIPCPEAVFNKTSQASTFDYDTQVQWEVEARAMSDVLAFWVPRQIDKGMPAFTTNVEFGEDLKSGKMIYGRPEDSQKNRYLDTRYFAQTNKQPITHLTDLMIAAMERLAEPAYRTKGSRKIPLHLWSSSCFKSWYKDLSASSNELLDAQVLNSYFAESGYFVSSLVKMNIFVKAENRIKDTEYVFFRKNTSSVVAYFSDEAETYVVCVEEFRSTVSNEKSMVLEFPGGSSPSDAHELENALSEFEEETGLNLKDANRLEKVATRQVLSTLSSHKASVFKVRLTKDEFEILKDADVSNKSFGNQITCGEITYVRVIPLSKLAQYPLDFSAIGMLACCELLQKRDE